MHYAWLHSCLLHSDFTMNKALGYPHEVLGATVLGLMF